MFLKSSVSLKQEIKCDKIIDFIRILYTVFNPSGDGKTFTKYTTTGAILELVDDAAHIHMGGDWHIPSPKQIKELLNNTTSAWTTRDGVNGRLFTSKDTKGNRVIVKLKHCDYVKWKNAFDAGTKEDYLDFVKWYEENVENIEN